MRLIKAPKLMCLDTGPAAFLVRFRAAPALVTSALVGAFWESHVFGQVVRQAANRADAAPIGYWRTAGGPEVDLVIERSGGELTVIECKWKEHHGPADAAGLNALESAESGRVKHKLIVCRTNVAYALPMARGSCRWPKRSPSSKRAASFRSRIASSWVKASGGAGPSQRALGRGGRGGDGMRQ